MTLNGFCFIETDDGSWEMVSMDDLRPGDIFKFVEACSLIDDVILDESAPAEQRSALLTGLVNRAERYRYSDIGFPSPWGGAGCQAEEVGCWE